MNPPAPPPDPKHGAAGESLEDLFAPSTPDSAGPPQAGEAARPEPAAPSGAESLFSPPTGGGEALAELLGRPPAPPPKPPPKPKQEPRPEGRGAPVPVKKDKDAPPPWEVANPRAKAPPPVTARKAAAKGSPPNRTARAAVGIAAVGLLLAGGIGGWIWWSRAKPLREDDSPRAQAPVLRPHVGSESEAALAAFAAVVRRAPAAPQELREAYGRLEAAAGALATSLRPGGPENADPRSWAILGEAQLALGVYDQADESLQRSLAMDGKDPRTAILQARAWAGRALLSSHVIRLMLGQAETDPRAAEWGVRIAGSLRRPTDPDRVGRDASLADLYQAAIRGEWAEVDRLAGDLRRSSPLQPPAELGDFALVRMLAPQPQNLAELDELLRQEPHHALALVVRGTRRAESGRLGEALSDFDRAVALRPKSAAFLLLRARARQLTGQIEGAGADLSQAEVLAPSPWDYAPYAAQIRRTLAPSIKLPPPK